MSKECTLLCRLHPPQEAWEPVPYNPLLFPEDSQKFLAN